MTTKELIRQTLEGSPDDVSIDAFIERLYLLRKIEEGLRQVEAGDVMDHEVVKRMFCDTAEIREA